MILCIGPTPAAQRVMVFSKLLLDNVNRTDKVWDGASGKAVNVAKVLKALGLNPLAVGFIGGNRGEQLCLRLAHAGIANEFLRVNAATRECVTVIDESG